MNFIDATDEIVAHLRDAGRAASDGVAPGLSLAVAAWSVWADLDPEPGWDLFGLDVCAAADLLGLAAPALSGVDYATVDRRSARGAARRLVMAIAEILDSATDAVDLPVAAQLGRQAAVVQLRRAADALSR